MREQNRTFDDVAADADISVRTLYNAADGMNCNRSTKRLIASALNKSVEDVWPDEEPDPPALPAPASGEEVAV